MAAGQADAQDPFAPFPNNVNPKTGEVNGPRGPEPTRWAFKILNFKTNSRLTEHSLLISPRYGDWEKKGRCSDF